MELLYSVLCFILLVIYIYVLYRRHKRLSKALILSLALVLFESHLFHILWGEQFAGELCEGVDKSLSFAFAKCATWSYDFLFDTYEVTVAASVVLMASLLFLEIRPGKNPLQFTMVVLTIVLALLLPLLPLEILLDYAQPYNYASALLAFAVVADELYALSFPEQEYDRLTAA
tara:strand:+ start:1026 stop:1544 length:519 start_codon:yes stop_codon:yes gene_type:complete